ncbi:MAG: hypothetical protein WDW38_005739 [Sanguina aurantia]
MLKLVVAGAHMTGLPLNHQLIGLGATFLRAAKTAPLYLMFSLGNRPALVRQTAEVAFANQGVSLAVEIWEVPVERVGEFLRDSVKGPLCIGDVMLEDGSSEKGFVGESYAMVGLPDVTASGGWRSFLQQQQILLQERA